MARQILSKRPGAIIVAPTWATSGSFEVFKSQCRVLSDLDYDIFFVAVPHFWADPENYQAIIDEYKKYLDAIPYDAFAIAKHPARSYKRYVKISEAFDRAHPHASATVRMAKSAALAKIPSGAVRFLFSRQSVLVICNHYFNLPFVERLLRRSFQQIPVVLETHDIQTNVLRNENPDLTDEDISHSLADELRVCSYATHLVHINCDEFEFFSSKLPNHRHDLVYPFIPEREKKDPSAAEITFLLVFSWHDTNAHSLEWFLNRVWSRYKGRAILKIIGNVDELMKKMYPETYARWASNFVGRVYDVAEYYRAASMVLIPVIAGEGIAIKFAEAMAYGKRVLFTPKAVRGLPEHVVERLADLLCRDENEFLAKMEGATDLDVVRSDPRSHQVYTELFSWTTYRRKYEAIAARNTSKSLAGRLSLRAGTHDLLAAEPLSHHLTR